MKKILIVAYNGCGNEGGVERVVSQQYGCLTELGYDVIIIDKKKINIVNKIKNKALSIVLFSIFSSCYLWSQKIRYGNSLFVISHGFSAPLFLSNLLISHGCMAQYIKSTQCNKKIISSGRILSLFEKISGKLAKKIWAVSDRVKIEWSDNYNISNDKISVVNNYIDTNNFTNYKPTSLVPTILFAGRLEAGKGTNHLLTLANKFPEIKFLFVSNIKPNIDLSSFKNITVHIQIPNNEMPKIYNSATCTILPSKYEGFELVTIESLSCGTPIIGYDVGAIHELSEKKLPGVFQVNDIYELELKISELIEQYNDPDYAISNRQSLCDFYKNILSEKMYFSKLKKEISHDA
ncbi:glycosyltransferase family 4 protein [Morganella morganii]